MRSIDVHAHLTPQCFWHATTEKSGDWHTLKREKDERGQENAIVGGRRQVLPPRARWTSEERLADTDIDSLTQAEMEAILWRNLGRLLGLTG
jgi:predicted TIM-barrel fold metal-dependent hydrolase